LKDLPVPDLFFLVSRPIIYDAISIDIPVGDLFKEEDSLDLTATNDGIFILPKLAMISINHR
jgi:hypothetical protein